MLKKQRGNLWIERSLCQQVMLGTLSGHFNQIRRKDAIKKVEFREETKESILYRNALIFLGIEKREDRG